MSYRDLFIPGGVGMGFLIGLVSPLRCGRDDAPRRTPPAFESASLEQCAQAEAACLAVGERLGITVTLPPWQAMVLAPVLDPR